MFKPKGSVNGGTMGPERRGWIDGAGCDLKDLMSAGSINLSRFLSRSSETSCSTWSLALSKASIELDRVPAVVESQARQAVRRQGVRVRAGRPMGL